MKPRVLLADDHVVLLEGLAGLLRNDFDLVGMFTDGLSLVQAAEQLQPDLVVLDISLPLLNGVEAARKLQKVSPKSAIVILTQHTERIFLQEALHAGVRGYVVKQDAVKELITALREVAAGRYFVTSAIGGITQAGLPGEWAGKSLTARQREVLQLVAEGKSAKEIASLLHISVRTAEFHKASIMDHLGLHTTAELAVYAARQRVLP